VDIHPLNSWFLTWIIIFFLIFLGATGSIGASMIYKFCDIKGALEEIRIFLKRPLYKGAQTNSLNVLIIFRVMCIILLFLYFFNTYVVSSLIALPFQLLNNQMINSSVFIVVQVIIFGVTYAYLPEDGEKKVPESWEATSNAPIIP
jgi:lysylphosphatidylglycerol synthetase-like protein (DUF2156 family)